MKKNFLFLFFMTVGTMSVSYGEKDTLETKVSDEFCRVTCSAEVGGITYTVSSGSIFTSCETAAENCADKLAETIAAVQ